MCLIITIAIHNALTDTIEKIDGISFSENIYSALESREDLFVDLVFDADGNLTESSIYEWDIKNNNRGQLVSRQINGAIFNSVYNEIDLSSDDQYLHDIVFNENGEMVSETLYNWDSDSNSKGAMIAKREVNETSLQKGEDAQCLESF